ncbi:MAG: hypothetical protein LBT78_07830 [Tannerella sp.]|nr:hypothetical protein [Tannerella sp.]
MIQSGTDRDETFGHRPAENRTYVETGRVPSLRGWYIDSVKNTLQPYVLPLTPEELKKFFHKSHAKSME